MDSLYKKLINYKKNKRISFAMPGLKGNSSLIKLGDPQDIDITEIDGFDDMHHADGVLKYEMERAARIFKAEKAFPLINGSTAGILAAISSINRNEKVIVSRNIHISVINAICLKNLKPVWISPMREDTGIYRGLSKEDIKQALSNHPDAKAVIITSPTYEGIVSDVKGIAEEAHKYQIPLITDSAHGAHFPLSPDFPLSAQEAGSDITIISLHKTLPALTQTGLLLTKGSLINHDALTDYWNIFQTSSPSYVLMASISACLDLIEEKGKALFSVYTERLKNLRNNLAGLKYIKLLESDDISKLTFIVKDAGRFAKKLLTNYNIQLEMASTDYAIAMTSPADTPDMYEALLNALQNEDKEEFKSSTKGDIKKIYLPQQKIFPGDAFELANISSEYVNISEAINKISAAVICPYPPGIPLIVPGEKFDERIIEEIMQAVDSGLDVYGIGYEVSPPNLNNNQQEGKINVKNIRTYGKKCIRKR